jgi:hypothetical protein
MSYKDEFPETFEINESDLSEVNRIIINGFMREGEFRTRDYFIQLFEEEISKHLNSSEEENQDWVDGISYCTHLLKNQRISDGN